MAGLLDEYASEFDDGEEPESKQSAAVDRVVEELSAAPQDVSARLGAYRKRFIKAGYYETIVQNGVIDEDGTEAAAELNAEVKDWALQRMAVLMGEVDDGQGRGGGGCLLDEREAALLKRLVGDDRVVTVILKIVEKVMMNQGDAPVAPTPTVRKLNSSPATPSKPQARKIQPKGGGTPPKAAPAAPKATPAPPPQGKKGPPPKAKKLADGELDLDAFESGVVFTDPNDNQMYKMVDNPRFDPTVQGSMPRTKMKVTAQIKNRRAAPTPTKSQLEAMSAAQSMETVNSGTSANSAAPGAQTASAGHLIAAAAKAMTED